MLKQQVHNNGYFQFIQGERSLHSTTLIPKDLETTVAEYKRLRPLMTQLHSEIGRLVRKDATFACAKRLQMLSKQGGKKVILFEDEFEMDILQDYQIYMHRPRGINAVQQMLNRNRYPQGSDERRLLEGMAQARFSIFLVKEIVQPAGFIGLDIYTGGEFFILDLTLPQQNVVGLLIGFRIFPYESVWMHTGANLTLGQTHDVAGFEPNGTQMNERQERTLNEEAIFRWRDFVSEMEW